MCTLFMESAHPGEITKKCACYDEKAALANELRENK